MSDATPTPPPGPEPIPHLPPAQQPIPAPQNGLGTAALVMGILQFFCLGPIGSILAIVFGALGMSKARQGLANNGGVAKTGFWLGIAGIVIGVLAGFVFVISGAAIFNAATESLDPANNTRTGLADGRYVMEPDSFLFVLEDCSYSGRPFSADTNEPGPGDVTIVGTGPTQCPGGSSAITVEVGKVSFTVTGGTASIDSVETKGLGVVENTS